MIDFMMFKYYEILFGTIGTAFMLLALVLWAVVIDPLIKRLKNYLRGTK